MQLTAPHRMVSNALRNAGFERGRSIANVESALRQDPPLEQLLFLAAVICSRAANPKGYGPGDVIGPRYEINGRFD